MFATYILKKEEDEGIKENLYEILEVLDWFKGAWALSRYPVMKKGKVISPFEQYDREDAQYVFEKRQLGDYEYTFVISQDEAKNMLEKGKIFTEKIISWLQKNKFYEAWL
jgi:hypothetical protein